MYRLSQITHFLPILCLCVSSPNGQSVIRSEHMLQLEEQVEKTRGGDDDDSNRSGGLKKKSP